jgi:hypothetical protein
MVRFDMAAQSKVFRSPNGVGSYGTRNIVVIGMMVLEPPTDCIVLSLDVSKVYSSGDPPFRGGFA